MVNRTDVPEPAAYQQGKSINGIKYGGLRIMIGKGKYVRGSNSDLGGQTTECPSRNKPGGERVY